VLFPEIPIPDLWRSKAVVHATSTETLRESDSPAIVDCWRWRCSVTLLHQLQLVRYAMILDSCS
jgi:hypothetical protein